MTSTRTRAKPRVQLDVKRLLHYLGGVSKIHRKLSLLGYEDVPSIVRMRKWVNRRSIPTNWLMVLLIQAKNERRQPIDLTEFVTSE